jgi:hypothetical protein
MLRSKLFKDLGWKRNIVRIMATWIALQVVQILLVLLVGIIRNMIGESRGIPLANLEGASLYILNAAVLGVGVYFAWQVVWINKGWWKAPEQDSDIEVDS